MTITEIKKIGKGERYSLYLDGQFVCVLEAEILVRKKLKTGEEISQDELDRIRLENGDLSCFDRALSYLEKNIKTEKGIRDYLKSKGYLDENIDKSVEKLKEYGYINDEVFAESYIKTYSSSKGANKIKYDLISKGVDKTIVDEKLEELILEEEEIEVCKKISEKYLKGRAIDQKLKQKLYNHLNSKGFKFDIISKVVREINWEGDDEDWN